MKRLTQKLRKAFAIFFVRRSVFSKKLYKWWRTDKYLWEEKRIIFWFITYYRYTIFKNGKTFEHIKLWKYSEPKYLKKAIKSTIYVGKKEFEEKYNCNKYLVPLNFELDLTIP